MYSLIMIITNICCLIFQSTPVELTPVDAGVEDITRLSESLRLESFDMREDQSFEQLFRIKGSPEIYVRRAGSLHAVFRDPIYVQTLGGNIPIIPTGTIYCIGEITHSVLNQLGVVASGKVVPTNETTPEQEVAKWNPVSPPISHARLSSIRFLDDEGYRRQRLASFVLEVSVR